MPAPTIIKTWTISPNNRIPFISLNDTMAKYLFQVKEFLKAHGYTIKGSSNGTIGAMDAVDRWVTSANVVTRGAASGNAQSWVVLTDGNAVNILLTYQGATDDVARISYSNGGLFVAAGTPQNQPTATDEAVISSAQTIINATTNQDRIWFGWVDSQSKLCRFAIARNGIWVGISWGIELISTAVTGAVVTWSPAVWGFGMVAATNYVSSNTQCGVAQVVASSVQTTCVVKYGVEQLANEGFNNNWTLTNAKCELQGATGPMARPLSIASSTVGARGKLGDLFDWWISRAQGGTLGIGQDGDLYGSAQFIGVPGFYSGGLMWPWNGTTAPQMR